MSRKTNLYHRLWYVNRNRRKLRVYAITIVFFIIIALFISFAEKRMRIGLTEFSEYRTKNIITNIVGEAVRDSFPEDMNYSEIVLVNRDKLDRITSIQTDVAKLNRIFANISLDIQRRISAINDENITIPLGVILGDSILAANGPPIRVKIIPAGAIETDFKSEFTSAGINQTKHRIYMEVKTDVGIIVPFMEKKSVITTNIPVAETVIVGEVPEYYMNNNQNNK